MTVELRHYEALHRMRAFEEAIAAAVVSGEIHGEMHLGLGQEAVALALGELRRPGDAIVSTHRGNLHALAAGVDPVALLAEIIERDGLCHGKGGHMHLFDPTHDFMTTGIVGASAPIAAGYALARRRSEDDRIAVAILGDGAMNQGSVAETMNLATLWTLPLVFLVEDNGWGISVAREISCAGRLAGRGEPFGMPAQECDGRDLDAILATLGTAVDHARERRGPTLVVAEVDRFAGHYEGDTDLYRPAESKRAARGPERDPIGRLRARLAGSGAEEEQLDESERRARATVEGWFAAARARPFPDERTAAEGVFA